MFWLLAAKKKNQLLLLHLLLKHLLLLQLLLPLKLLLPLQPTLLLPLPALLLLLAPLSKLPKTLHPLPLQSNFSLRLEKPPQGGFFYARSAGRQSAVLAFQTLSTNYKD